MRICQYSLDAARFRVITSLDHIHERLIKYIDRVTRLTRAHDQERMRHRHDIRKSLWTKDGITPQIVAMASKQVVMDKFVREWKDDIICLHNQMTAIETIVVRRVYAADIQTLEMIHGALSQLNDLITDTISTDLGRYAVSHQPQPPPLSRAECTRTRHLSGVTHSTRHRLSLIVDSDE